MRGGVIAALATALIGISAGSASAITLVADDFEDGNAAGWVTTGGTWIVNQQETKVLRQSSFVANALARTGQPGWRNYTVVADVKPESFNGLPGYAGVVSRAQSTSTYYALVLRANDTAALTRTVNGTTVTLASIRVAVDLDEWYTLALRTAGQSLTGWVNGQQLSASDGFIINGGPGGLLTTWCNASFDNVTIAT